MRKLNIGNSDFKKLRLNDEYYVDKSLLIKVVLDGSEVTLLPRPRRFGKTLNMTMLRYFFEKTAKSNAGLFAGLKIADDSDAMKHQGQYPVIYLSLKDIKGNDWAGALQLIAAEVSRAYRQHEHIVSGLNCTQEKRWQNLITQQASLFELQSSLKELISDLFEYYKKPVIILIDEYDSPVIDAWNRDFYDEMINFMRTWLGGGLKHSDGLATFRAVITGILRVTRESIFSDLNNLKVCSILTAGLFADKFGFTEFEVGKILDDFKLSPYVTDVQAWYNGYIFGGDTTIYNPWSVVNFIDNATTPIGPQWLNTSSNALIHHELKAGGLKLKRDLELLLQGKELRYPITEHTIFEEIGRNPQNIWSFLCMSGYLNAVDVKRDSDTLELTYNLQIPNLEIRMVYQQFIRRYLAELNHETKVTALLQALKRDDIVEFEQRLQGLILAILSFYDTAKQPEAVYHAFLLGLLANLHGSFDIKSNAESGYGRADIVMIPKYPELTGKIIELKSIKQNEDIEQATVVALEQIENKIYATRLIEAGITPENIIKLAIVVCGKQVKVTKA